MSYRSDLLEKLEALDQSRDGFRIGGTMWSRIYEKMQDIREELNSFSEDDDFDHNALPF